MWDSGWWARFVLEGRISKPRPSKLCNISNTVYVVARLQDLSVHVTSIAITSIGRLCVISKETLCPTWAQELLCPLRLCNRVVSVQEGGQEVYVLRWPLDVDPAYANYGSAMAIMKRGGGLLLGLPAEMNPPQALQLASAEGEALLGPHTLPTVPGVFGGLDQLTGDDLNVRVFAGLSASDMEFPDPATVITLQTIPQ